MTVEESDDIGGRIERAIRHEFASAIITIHMAPDRSCSTRRVFRLRFWGDGQRGMMGMWRFAP